MFCVSIKINGNTPLRRINHSQEAGRSEQQKSLKARFFSLSLHLLKSTLGCSDLLHFFHARCRSLTPTLPHLTHMQKWGLFMCQKHRQTMSYSAPLLPQWEVPGPTSPHTISPRPCPTPTIVPHSTHTHTMADSRARGPTVQYRHTKTHTSPRPVREEGKRTVTLQVWWRRTELQSGAVFVVGCW